MQYQTELLIPILAILTGAAIPISVFIWLYYDAKGKRETVLEIAKHLDDDSKLDDLLNLFEERKKEPIDYRRNGVIAIFVFFLGKWLQLIRFEMAIIWICFAMVMGAELLNTSIEKLCDKVESKEDPQIKIIKDVAAGAVLFISICAAVIGLYIILPKFLDNI